MWHPFFSGFFYEYKAQWTAFFGNSFFCDNVKHFIVTFDQFNAFLLKKCVNLIEVKTLLTLHFWMVYLRLQASLHKGLQLVVCVCGGGSSVYYIAWLPLLLRLVESSASGWLWFPLAVRLNREIAVRYTEWLQQSKMSRQVPVWWSLSYRAVKKEAYVFISVQLQRAESWFHIWVPSQTNATWQMTIIIPVFMPPAEIIGFKQIRLWDRMEDCTGMSGMGGV